MWQLTNVDNNIVESQLDNVVGDLLGYAPARNDLVDLSSGLLRNLIDDRRVWRVKGVQTLLLDAGLQKLLVTLDLSGTCLDLLQGRGSSRISTLWWWSSILLTGWCAALYEQISMSLLFQMHKVLKLLEVDMETEKS
jgi:hypothetical protein